MKLMFFLLIFVSPIISLSQAQLPTFCDFSNPKLPYGWTSKGTNFYSNSGFVPPAIKFDHSGDYLLISFENSPDSLSFYLVGNLFSGGEFLVEESKNSVTWIELSSFKNIPSVYTLFELTPSKDIRFVRFRYKNKITGNVGLDNVLISLGVSSETPKLRCWMDDEFVEIHSDVFNTNNEIGKVDTLLLVLENIGNQDLIVDSIVIEGLNKSDYAILNSISSISSLGKDSLRIVFSPAYNGSSYVLVTLHSNDFSVPSYQFNLKSIVGDFASEPDVKLSNLIFSNVSTFTFGFSFKADSLVDGFLVLKSLSNGALSLEDGYHYSTGDYIDNWQVVSNDTSKIILPKSIVANTSYYFKIIPFNGVGAFTNHQLSGALSSSISTPATMQSIDYYESINEYSSNVLDQLTALTNQHQSFQYNDYALNMIYPFEMRDTFNNQYALTCVYSGEVAVFNMPFDWSQTGFSREHSYCHNWMPTNPANNPEKPEYQDLHQLFPTRLNNVNGTRSNYPLGEVITELESFKGCRFGYNTIGQLVFEPRDQHKGDVARAIMYMATCYNKTNENWGLRSIISTTIPYGQDQDVLKKWSLNDLPDNYEIARNDYIASLQGNRNPFIDNPNYACLIDFVAMERALEGDCQKLKIKGVSGNNSNIEVYPNPAINNLRIQSKNTVQRVMIFNLFGVEVFSKEYNFSSMEIDLTDIQSGMYQLFIVSNDEVSVLKLVVAK